MPRRTLATLCVGLSLAGLSLASVFATASTAQSGENSASTPATTQISPLKSANGVKIGKINYRRAEITPYPALAYEVRVRLADQGDGVRYLYNQIDLNGDGLKETLVYLVGQSTCGSGGCTLLVFTSTEAGFELVSKHTVINNPIVVSNQKTKGWRDLIVYQSGGGAQSGYRVLRFNGKTYPSNPSTAPALPAKTVISGQAVIADEITADTPAPWLAQ
jgi:hypothetical protein